MRLPYPDEDPAPWWLVFACAALFVLVTGSPLWFIALVVWFL